MGHLPQRAFHTRPPKYREHTQKGFQETGVPKECERREPHAHLVTKMHVHGPPTPKSILNWTCDVPETWKNGFKETSMLEKCERREPHAHLVNKMHVHGPPTPRRIPN